ncbi:MAG: MFS transporter [Eubacteriales bacterium]|nr:MFS transporter [Eubacteriales bacterium]
MEKKYKKTRLACYVGYIVQAAVNNLTPLLFVTFNREFDISIEKIGILILFNFFLQILVDITSTLYVDKIGYRATTLIAHGMSFVGFVLLSFLPYVIRPFTGLLVSVFFLACGGGLIEVIISPVTEALPSDNKAAAMSFLHSFYCWGQMLTVLLTTVFFSTAGIENWRIVAILWSMLPLSNFILFLFVPILSLPSAKEGGGRKRNILTPAFFCLFILMICSGAGELAMSQWASMFFESVLEIEKSVGDILGPCMFAALMGCGRILSVTCLKNIKIENLILASSILCIIAYSMVSLSSWPALSFLGCALCGLSIAVMWPATYSLGTKYCPLGGTLMFALFAFAGDIGCAVGPEIVALVSSATDGGILSDFLPFIGSGSDNRGLRVGLFVILIFPISAIISTLFLKKIDKKRTDALKNIQNR